MLLFYVLLLCEVILGVTCVDAHVISELRVVGKNDLTKAARQNAFWPKSVILLSTRIRLKYCNIDIYIDPLQSSAPP